MFGMPKLPYGLLGVAGGSDTRPTNTPEDTSALQKLYATVQAQNRTPNGMVARGFNQFGPQPTGPVAPMLPTPPVPAEVDMSQPKPPVQATDDAPGALSPNWAGPHSVGGAPLPNVGPTSVGGAPLPTSSPLDTAQWPAGPGQSPQASGPDVINKLMSYFNNKDNPSDG